MPDPRPLEPRGRRGRPPGPDRRVLHPHTPRDPRPDPTAYLRVTRHGLAALVNVDPITTTRPHPHDPGRTLLDHPDGRTLDVDHHHTEIDAAIDHARTLTHHPDHIPIVHVRTPDPDLDLDEHGRRRLHIPDAMPRRLPAPRHPGQGGAESPATPPDQHPRLGDLLDPRGSGRDSTSDRSTTEENTP